MHNLVFIPTYRCNHSCDYCYIDTLKLDRNYELPYNDRLVALLNQFNVSVSGGEPFQCSYIDKLLEISTVNTIETNFSASKSDIDQVLNSRPDIKFGVSYHPSGYRRQDQNLKEKISLYSNNISNLRYIVFIQNYQNIIDDLEEIFKFGVPVEPIFYLDSTDINFVSGQPDNVKLQIRLILSRIFPDIFTKKILEYHDEYYLGPFNYLVYNNRQRQDKSICNECYTLGRGFSNCQNCLDYFNQQDIAVDLKEKYMYEVDALKFLLGM